MERCCEYCGVPRPVVYCQADVAFLCLSCDAKVHSANALSGRHYRDLLCDSCRDNTAIVRCIDHSMLLCRGCESNLHDGFFDHKKLMLNSFTGCPSVQQFASLWGFDVSEQAQFSLAGVQEQQNNHQNKQNNSLVAQQILNLKKFQVTESEKQSSPTFSSSGNADAGLNPSLKQHSSFTRNLRSFDNLSHSLENHEDFHRYISQLDQLSNTQFWSQNLQDLGVCEDSGHFDDSNIPDVDISFRNFEELFASEVDLTHPLLEDTDLMWSEVTKAALNDDSELCHAKTIEDVSAASLISLNNGITSKDKTQRSDNVALGTFGNMKTLSESFLSAESSGIDCLDSGHSENFTESADSSRKISQERKKSQSHGKRNQLAGSNDDSNTRRRIKSRYVNVQGHQSVLSNVPRIKDKC